MRLTWLADVLRDAGLTVVEWPNWQSFGSRELDDDLWGIVVHHTASAPGSEEGRNALALRTRSASGVPPPRAHLLVARSGTVHVLSAMKANHAGSGSWPGVRDQAQLVGIEIDNNGLGSEVFPQHQAEAVLRACAAICAHQSWEANRVISHHEWAPARKPDPRGPVALYPWGGTGPWDSADDAWDMILFRADLTTLLEDDMPLTSAEKTELIQATTKGTVDLLAGTSASAQAARKAVAEDVIAALRVEINNPNRRLGSLWNMAYWLYRRFVMGVQQPGGVGWPPPEKP